MTPYSINHRPKSRFQRRYILIPVVIVLGIVVLIAILEKTNTINLFREPATPANPGRSTGINYDPPTKDDAAAVDEHKENLPKSDGNPNPSPTPPGSSPSTKKAVKPVIVTYSTSAVRGYVPGIIENGGNCIATLAAPGQTAAVTRTGTAAADAQNTVCVVDYTGTGATTGWKITLTYQSATSEGTSDASTL